MEESSDGYQVTSYRWVVLFFFFNTTVYVSCCQTSLTPVAAPLAKAFGVPVLDVTMTSIIFSITYIPMTFVAIWMFKVLRPSTCFRIACANLLIGSWIRSFSADTEQFGMILVGYTIISLSYPILLAAVTLVCNTWLGDHERTFWTQICGLSIPIGTVISFLMTGLIYSDEFTMRKDTRRLILFQNVWATLVAVPFFLLVRDKPTEPPSSIAAEKQKRARLIPAFRRALKDKNYVYLLIIFALVDGEFISFSSVMSLLFDYYKVPPVPPSTTPTPYYSSSLISLYGGSTAIFGVLASIVAGRML